jgi:hypothetical protein
MRGIRTELADLPLEHFPELGILDQPVHDSVGPVEVELLPDQVVGCPVVEGGPAPAAEPVGRRVLEVTSPAGPEREAVPRLPVVRWLYVVQLEEGAVHVPP